MSRHTYRWYRIPDRLALGLYALAASVWRDWVPRKTCDRCRHYKNHNGGHCYRMNLTRLNDQKDKFTCTNWERWQ